MSVKIKKSTMLVFTDSVEMRLILGLLSSKGMIATHETHMASTPATLGRTITHHKAQLVHAVEFHETEEYSQHFKKLLLCDKYTYTHKLEGKFHAVNPI